MPLEIRDQVFWKRWQDPRSRDFNDWWSLLDQLTTIYLAAPEPTRRAIEAFFVSRPRLQRKLFGYARSIRRHLASDDRDDAQRTVLFKKGLAAIAIENLQTGPRLTGFALFKLINSALRRGLADRNVERGLEEVARLASGDPPFMEGEADSMSDFLMSHVGGIMPGNAR